MENALFNVLVVDDVESSRELLEKILSDAGYRVQTAESGSLALDIVSRQAPDIILLDFLMPDISGLEVCRRLKGKRESARIPVIFLSAYGNSESKREAFELGGVDYIPKPFDMVEVLSRVKTHLKLSFLHRELENRIESGNRKVFLVQEQLVQSQKIEAIGHITAGVAHDFKNLIGIIMSGAEYLQINGLYAAEGKPYVESILDAAHKARELSGNILKFSRQSQSKSFIDLKEIVQNVVVLIKHSFSSNIEVEYDCEVDGACIQGNPVSIQTSLLNIAINARDAMPDGGRIHISMSLCESVPDSVLFGSTQSPQSWVLVEFEDFGPGMPPEVAAKIFDPYFTTKGNGQGTGLGLSTLNSMVREHKAALGFNTVEGSGTTFRIYFPIATMPEHGFIGKRKLPVRTGDESILIVDDEEWIRRNFQDLLNGLGYDVYTAENGKTAIEFYTSNPDIDLVIVDMIMPVMNGYDTIQQLMQIDPNVKIIISTGFSEPQMIKDALAAGAKGIVHKPASVGELTQNIARVMGE